MSKGTTLNFLKLFLAILAGNLIGTALFHFVYWALS